MPIHTAHTIQSRQPSRCSQSSQPSQSSQTNLVILGSLVIHAGGVRYGPGELATAGRPTGGVSYGRDTRRSEPILSLSILSPLSYLPYPAWPLSYRIGSCPIYRNRYTKRAEYPMERIPAGRGRKGSYRIGNRMIPTSWNILWAPCCP